MHDPFNAFADIDPAAAPGTGPLADLLIGIKSNIAVRGLPWTGGMGTRREVIAERDADCVARLRAAGAKIAGTLGMHEAALGATSDNAFYGRIHNPHRQGFTPGGSSGGSGTAVAAGLVDAALGTDTLGSIRIPAAYCGVYGLKPTLGTVSTEGLVHLGTAFDVIGPLARDLDVIEGVWSALSAHGEEKPSPLGNESYFILPDLAHIETQPAVRAAYERILAIFSATPRALALTDAPTAIRLAALVPCVEELKVALGTARDGPGVSDEIKAVIAAVEKIPPAPDVIERTRATLIDALGTDGFLITPTTPHEAFAHGTRAPSSQADFTCLASVAGLPAIAIPAGTGDTGLPISIQITGPAHSEGRLIALARSIEGSLT